MGTPPFLFVLIVIIGFQVRPGQFDHISSPGDIILGGLFPVHRKGDREDVCGRFSEIPGYQYMEAMRYAVDRINDRSDILQGIRLGTIIYDTCRSPTITADRTKEFIKFSLSSSKSSANTSEFAGVIGPFTSGNSIIAANFFRVFNIPQISYGGLSVELSDKDRYGYFFRTVPPDSFFAEGLAELLDHFRWTYVSIIYSTGTYSETGTQEVVKAISKRDICLAKKHRLPRFPTDADYNDAIAEVMSVEEASIVVFVTIQRDSRRLLKAKRDSQHAKKLAIVASVSWSNRDDITKGLEQVAAGTITFGHTDGKNTEFENYFRSLNLSNYNQYYTRWFDEFWEIQFNCSLLNTTNYSARDNSKKCTREEQLSSHRMEIAPVRVVINAVYAIAYSLENMRKHLCPNVSGMCREMIPLPRKLLKHFLENITFPDSSFKWPIWFNQNNEVAGNYTVFNFRESGHGVYSYIPVGKWTSQLDENGEISGKLELNKSAIHWPNGATFPMSVCSLACGLGNVKQPRSGAPEKCCWDCVTCKKFDVILNNTCRACAEGFIPDANFSTCLKLEAKYMNLNMPLAVFFAFLAFLGIITNLTVLVVFYINRNHQLIRATNIDACYFIFCGIFLIFITSIAFLAKPTRSLCYAQRFLLGNSFTICYAALLAKLVGIHNLSKSENQRPRSRDSTSFLGVKLHLIITISIIIIQLLLSLLATTRNKPILRENFNLKSEDVFLECAIKSTAFVAYVAGSLILVFVCTGYAFRTRNIPKNFRETLYISLTTYISNVLWVVLLAYYLNTESYFSRHYLIAGISVVIGWLTLLGLFTPVFYHLRTKKVFDRTSLIDWDGSSGRRLRAGQSELSLYNDTPKLRARRVEVACKQNEGEMAEFNC